MLTGCVSNTVKLQSADDRQLPALPSKARSEQSTDPIGVFAELLVRADRRAEEVAGYADRLRIARPRLRAALRRRDWPLTTGRRCADVCTAGHKKASDRPGVGAPDRSPQAQYGAVILGPGLTHHARGGVDPIRNTNTHKGSLCLHPSSPGWVASVVLPRPPHPSFPSPRVNYVEVFCGGAALYFLRPVPAAWVINDVNGGPRFEQRVGDHQLVA